LGASIEGALLDQLRFQHWSAPLWYLLGLLLLHQAVRRRVVWSWSSLGGGLLIGWGLYNVVDGLLCHYLLGLHRLRPSAANSLLWDLGFLLAGIGLVIAGVALARDRRAAFHRSQTDRALCNPAGGRVGQADGRGHGPAVETEERARFAQRHARRRFPR
jgi:uncharacterized membrane protein